MQRFNTGTVFRQRFSVDLFMFPSLMFLLLLLKRLSNVSLHLFAVYNNNDAVINPPLLQLRLPCVQLIDSWQDAVMARWEMSFCYSYFEICTCVAPSKSKIKILERKVILPSTPSSQSQPLVKKDVFSSSVGTFEQRA